MKQPSKSSYAASIGIVLMIAAGCSGASESTPNSVPAYLSCKGAVDSQLVAELVKSSSTLRMPDRNSVSSSIDEEKLSFSCDPGNGVRSSMGVRIAENGDVLAALYTPPGVSADSFESTGRRCNIRFGCLVQIMLTQKW